MPWKNGNPPLYHVWRDMIGRCYTKSGKQYKDYGGRGIRVCPQWRYDYKQWYADVSPPFKPGLTFDRFPDNDGDYTPTNFRWATRKQQQRNRRNTKWLTIEGKDYLAIELVELTGLKWDTIVERAEAGLSYNEVIAEQKRVNLDGFKLGAKASSIARKSRTHCKNGHKYTPETTGVRSEGKYTWRVCLVCRPGSAPLKRVRLFLKRP